MKFDATELQRIEAAAGLGRVEIYTSIHKAMRAWMVHVQTRVGQFDVHDLGECQATLSEVHSLLDGMESHLDKENTYVHPMVEARCPGATADLDSDHVGHVAAIDKLRRHTAAVINAPATARAAAALYLYRELSLFVAENLEHMRVEETVCQQLLWQTYSDAELADLNNRIVAAVPEHEMAVVMRWMIPAVAHAERVAMLADMRQHAPEPVFAGMLAIAQTHLSAADWAKLQADLGLQS